MALARLAAAHAPPVAEAVVAAQRRATRVLRGALSGGASSGLARSAPTSTHAVASLVGRGAPTGLAPPPAAPGEGCKPLGIGRWVLIKSRPSLLHRQPSHRQQMLPGPLFTLQLAPPAVLCKCFVSRLWLLCITLFQLEGLRSHRRAAHRLQRRCGVGAAAALADGRGLRRGPARAPSPGP